MKQQENLTSKVLLVAAAAGAAAAGLVVAVHEAVKSEKVRAGVAAAKVKAVEFKDAAKVKAVAVKENAMAKAEEVKEKANDTIAKVKEKLTQKKTAETADEDLDGVEDIFPEAEAEEVPQETVAADETDEAEAEAEAEAPEKASDAE